MNRFDWSSFFSNLIAVILGIFITFGIQGMIDRKREKKDVLAALELVKEELINNRQNLQDVIDIIENEREIAGFIQENIGKFARCDTDSLLNKHNTLCTEYFFTVTDDALELLKTSSLFQKMNDKNLALNIIKAYDFLETDAQAFNTHEKYKTSLFDEAHTEKTKKSAMYYTGTAFLKIFYASEKAGYFLKSVMDMADSSFLSASIPEIDATISEIDARLKN